jgi:hypothetical protein
MIKWSNVRKNFFFEFSVIVITKNAVFPIFDDFVKNSHFFTIFKYSRESEFIHNTVSYRTVPYPTVFRYNFFHARGLLARGVPFFLPKILRFSAKKVKSANRAFLKIKTVLAF